ncbi:hypothetical protein [Streptomyces sp. HNM0574]|uniref:hypothetical protein n=1 Tax=Streptomyces sp. HNM0574 TaxID=2714954 RepID=UPI00146B9C6D|nr:hypothetical protein [Streptomyces sp. HNM0574]NLU68220.1 hypothetical protein [Streptomyces sp. HNM0574]
MGERGGRDVAHSLRRVWAGRRSGGSGHVYALTPQLRHGIAAFGALVATAAMLWQVFGQTGNWWNNWAAGVTTVGRAVLVFGTPVTVGFACWLGVADARERTEWLGATAPRRPLPCVLMRVAPAVLWPLVGYLFVVVLVLFTLESTEYRSSNPFDALASDIALFTLVACLGYALGRAVRLRLAAPVAGLLTSVGISFLIVGLNVSSEYPQPYRGSGVRGLKTLYPDSPPAWLPWLVSALFLALAVEVLLLCTRRWRPAALCALATVSALIGTGVSHNGSQGFFYRAAPDPVVLDCTRSTPHICRAEDTSGPLAQDPAEVKKLAERIDGIPGTPTHFVLTYAHSRSVNDFSYGSIDGLRGHSWWTITMQAEEANDTYLYELASYIADAPRTPCAKGLLRAWLLPPRHRSKEESAWAAELDAFPETQRKAWLADYFSGRDCAPLPERPAPHAKAAP